MNTLSITRSRSLISVLALSLALSTALMTRSLTAEEPEVTPVPVESLRGPVPVGEEKEAPDMKKYPKEQERMDLQFVGQPPLIPHSIRGYEITANNNDCMRCHAWENAVSAKAPRVGISHFRDRDGRVLSDLSPNRYFCNACHVPQVNAKPLVPNQFEPVKSLKQP